MQLLRGRDRPIRQDRIANRSATNLPHKKPPKRAKLFVFLGVIPSLNPVVPGIPLANSKLPFSGLPKQSAIRNPTQSRSVHLS